MSDLPRIAIITPSFNTARYLGAAIRSVLDQDYPNLEYLVMDGHSTDETVVVLRSFGDRLRWVSKQDDGQADAIRKGFAQTSGDILGWLNADDTYEPGALRAIAEFFAAHPDVMLVYGNANFIDADGNPIGPCAHVEPYNFKRLLHYTDFIVQPAAFCRRSAYDAIGGLDPSLHWAMDYDLWLKIAKRFPVAHLPRLLANYRWLSSTKTATGGFARIDEITTVARRHGASMPAYVRLERVNLLLRQAYDALRHDQLGAAASSFARAIKTVCSSPRTMWSMLQPRTWRIIWTGQVLRKRAEKVTPSPA